MTMVLDQLLDSAQEISNEVTELPCEKLFEQVDDTTKAHIKSVVDKLQSHGVSIRRMIMSESLERTKEVTHDGVTYNLPMYSVIDPMTDSSTSELIKTCEAFYHNGSLNIGDDAAAKIFNAGILPVAYKGDRAVPLISPEFLGANCLVKSKEDHHAGRLLALLACPAGLAAYMIAKSLNAPFDPVLLLTISVVGVLASASMSKNNKNDLLFFHTALPGKIPPGARQTIINTHSALSCLKMDSLSVKLIMEGDWKVINQEKIKPTPKDPLIVIRVANPGRKSIFLYVDRFDCTGLEDNLAREHAVKI